MDEQICLFEEPMQPAAPEQKDGILIQFPLAQEDSNVVHLPGVSKKKDKRTHKKEWKTKDNFINNARAGQEQTVYAIKSMEDRKRMAAWLLENKDRKYFLAFTLGINLGLRANELLQLRQCDVFNPDGSFRYNGEDLSDTSDRVMVDQSKTHKRRRLYLNEACINALSWYFPVKGSHNYSQAYLFKSREGGHIEVGTFCKVLKEAAAACGIKLNVGTHTLRKTYGYEHFKRNHDVVYLQQLFGHSSPLITMRYIGVTEEDEKAAYHAMSMDFLSMLNQEEAVRHDN